jgi:hypothetical protein
VVFFGLYDTFSFGVVASYLCQHFCYLLSAGADKMIAELSKPLDV